MHRFLFTNKYYVLQLKILFYTTATKYGKDDIYIYIRLTKLKMNSSLRNIILRNYSNFAEHNENIFIIANYLTPLG